ncbi:MAG: lamin tail domain-containing protein [Candidatus Marinimicrobia bacterium]|nr:lamin tail domain-containing protein [Candidatus Neomarinimicrobiota bacterium]
MNTGTFTPKIQEILSKGSGPLLIYIAQNRSTAGQAYPLLKYPPYTGTTLTVDDTLWAIPKTVTGRFSILLDEANNHVLLGAYYSGNIYVHDMTTGASIDTIFTGQNRNFELAFDAAGNLYSTDNSGEYWNVFSAPDGANSYTTPGRATLSIETPVAINTVFISELADPNNDLGLRFVEIHNAADLALDLTGWELRKYTNASATVSQTLALVGSIPALGNYVIASGVVDGDFETAYGMAPDMFDGALDNVAGSNGDDNLELVDPSGAVIDQFGVPGEDGTGTNHEFEDGRAVRLATVTVGNPVWDPAEWAIDSDIPSGLGPQDAPGDFDPYVWPTVIPLELVSAFSISDTEIEAVYSGDLTGVDVANYSMAGTAVTFASATIDAIDASLVHLVASASILGDVVVDTLIDAVNVGTFDFYAGIMPIGFTNALNPGGQMEQDITATFVGLVTANDAFNNVWVSDGNEAYMGVLVFDYDFDGLVAVGDELMFTGYLDIYNNLSELKGPVVLGIESSGNPTIPAMITGADIDSSLAADTNPAEQWEGQLVKIDGATVLAYDAAAYTYELSDDGSVTKFLVGDNVNYHLEAISLTVGTNYDIVGVVDYTAGTYRINPRDLNDIVDNSILPSIVKVMSISDTEIDVAYSLELAAADVANYSLLGTAVSFSTATIDAEDLTLLHLVASAAITADVITDTLIDAANADTVLLYAGISPIAFTNAMNPGGSFERGIPASVAGLITADDEYNNVWINDDVGAYNGVLLFDYDLGDTLDVGDQVVLAGDLDIYNNLSELKRISLIEHISSDNPTIPSPITGADIDSSLAADTNPAEQWEGQLVKIDSAMVLAYDATGYRYELSDDGGLTKFLLGDDVDFHFGVLSLAVGSMYDLTGVVSYYYGHYIISPRDMDDVVELDIAGPELAGVVAVSETQLQVRFSEPVVSTDALMLANYSVSDDLGSENPTAITMITEAIYLLDVPAIVPNMPYTVTVNAVHDLNGNAISDDSMINVVLDIPGNLPIDRIMNDFVTDVGHWGHPTYSGSTSGILATSTFAPTDSLAFAGTHSGEMILLDDPAISGGWFVRLWNVNRVDRIDADSKMFFYLRGGNADVQARIVVQDDGGYEAGPWHDITFAEDDWQVVSVDLENDQLTGWINGNGSIQAASGTVAIDGIQIRCSEDVSVNLYLDMVTERYNVDPVEVTFNVDMNIQALMETFVPGTDFVDVAGTFNGWGNTPMVMEDPESDSVYTFTVTDVYPGETLNYKFRINGNWDTSEFPNGGADRVYVVPDTNSVVSHFYNDVSVYVGIGLVGIPTEFALHDNYPNPFNPITNIKYDIPENAYVTLSIYNMIGQHVIDLVNEDQAPGFYHLQWNGLDKSGTPVSSGLYIYRLTTPDFTRSEKMTFLK